MATRRFFAAGQQALRERGTAKPASAPTRQRTNAVSISRPLLTTEQVRERLGLGSINAVYRLMREHRLPSVRLGRAHRFSQDELERWLAARQHNPGKALELVEG